MTTIENMFPVTRLLIESQQGYTEQLAKEDNLIRVVQTDFAARVVTLGATLLIHAELVRRVANLCFLMILYSVSKSNTKELNRQRVECTIALAMCLEFFAALFKKNMLILQHNGQEIPLGSGEEQGKIELVVEGEDPRSARSSIAEARRSAQVEMIEAPPGELPPLRLVAPHEGAASPSSPQLTPSPRSSNGDRWAMVPEQERTAPPAAAAPSSPQLTPSPRSSSGEPWAMVQGEGGTASAGAAAGPSEDPPSFFPWRWLNFFTKPASDLSMMALRETPLPIHDEEAIRRRIEQEGREITHQFEQEQLTPFTLIAAPSEMNDDSGRTRCTASHKVDRGFIVGMCQFDVSPIPSETTQFLGRFELLTEQKPYEVFVAGNIESLYGSKAAIYLKNHFVKTFSDLLHQQNVDQLSVKGTWNALHLVFGQLRNLYRSDFADTLYLEERAYATVSIVLDGAIWTANLGSGGALLLNVEKKEDEPFMEQLTLHNEPNEPRFFGAQKNHSPRISITPIGQSGHIVLTSSNLIRLGSAHGIGKELKFYKDQHIETLAYNLVYTGVLKREGKPLSCMIIQLPKRLLQAGSADGSGIHLGSASQVSEGEVVSAADLDYTPPLSAKDPLDEPFNGLSPPLRPAVAAAELPPLNSPPVSPQPANEENPLLQSLGKKMKGSPQSGTSSPVMVGRLSQDWDDIDQEVPLQREAVTGVKPADPDQLSDFDLSDCEVEDRPIAGVMGH